MNETNYRRLVRDILENWTQQMIEELNDLATSKFYDGIDKLAFEIHHKCSINLYTMDDSDNEYFPEEPKVGYYHGHKSFVKGLDAEMYDKIYDIDGVFEEAGGNSFITSSIETMLWFAECWKKFNCKDLTIKSEIEIHDHYPMYDLNTHTLYGYEMNK